MRLIASNTVGVFFALCLLMSMAAARADSPADQRIESIIAHVKTNPTSELPIGKHPKDKNRVFCRLFNISLSSRAYFQLQTDASLDASSNKDLEKVARWYLDNPDKVRDPDAAYWAGEYHSAALAQFGSRGTVRRGAITRATERLLLHYMLDFVSHWSRLKLYDASLSAQTYFYPATENHWWQETVTSWGYLLALKDDPEFKDRKLEDGKSLHEHYKKTCHYIENHMQQRARKGFLLEISSGGYSGRMRNMWHLIHDISPDERLRKLAKDTLDLWWTFWAEEHVNAERGGGKVRHRDLKGLSPNTENHLIPSWAYFGIGNHHMDYIKTIAADKIRLNVHYMELFSKYRPNEVITKILDDRNRAAPYAITHRCLGKEAAEKARLKFTGISGYLYDIDQADCLKYSWVTPTFVLGTVMRPPYDGNTWQKGMAQGWWHGLLIAGASPNHPPERVVPTLMTSRDPMSDQYAVQSKGSFMARKIPGLQWGSNNTNLPMGIFISSGLKSSTEHKGDFLFIKSPGCWVAVRSAGGDFTLANRLLLDNLKSKGDFYRPVNDLQPMIIEAANPESYESFDAFKKAATGATLVFKKGQHSYQSLSGDLLTMHDDRSKPQINGTAINYNPATAYDSRYVKSKWDSGVIEISAGGMKSVLDFMTK
jgi:hypothetical protein